MSGSVSQACKMMGYSRDSFYRQALRPKECVGGCGSAQRSRAAVLRRTKRAIAARADGPRQGVLWQSRSDEYQLYLAVENIDHSRTKAKSPQTNGICERFHRTMPEEFYSVAFRKKLHTSLEELQSDLDVWLGEYNEKREHLASTATGKRPGKLFWIPNTWRRRKCSML